MITTLNAWQKAQADKDTAKNNAVLMDQALKENGLTRDNITYIATVENTDNPLIECVVYSNIVASYPFVDELIVSFTSPLTKPSLKDDYSGIYETAEALDLVVLKIDSPLDNQFAVNPDAYDVLTKTSPFNTIINDSLSKISYPILEKHEVVMGKLGKKETIDQTPERIGRSGYTYRTEDWHQEIIDRMTNNETAPAKKLAAEL